MCYCTQYEYNLGYTTGDVTDQHTCNATHISSAAEDCGAEEPKTMLACLAYCKMRPYVVQYPDTASSILIITNWDILYIFLA